MSPNRIYFVKRDGFGWGVWWRWIDERVEPRNGRGEWPAAPRLRYWSFRRASVAAESLWRAYWQGVMSETDERLAKSTRGPQFRELSPPAVRLHQDGSVHDGLAPGGAANLFA